jgi:hypothetical protein
MVLMKPSVCMLRQAGVLPQTLPLTACPCLLLLLLLLLLLCHAQVYSMALRLCSSASSALTACQHSLRR